MPQPDPGLRGRGSGGEGAVIAQHHQGLVAEIRHQPFTLVEVQGHALIVVVGQMRQHREGVLG